MNSNDKEVAQHYFSFLEWQFDEMDKESKMQEEFKLYLKKEHPKLPDDPEGFQAYWKEKAESMDQKSIFKPIEEKPLYDKPLEQRLDDYKQQKQEMDKAFEQFQKLYNMSPDEKIEAMKKKRAKEMEERRLADARKYVKKNLYKVETLYANSDAAEVIKKMIAHAETILDEDPIESDILKEIVKSQPGYKKDAEINLDLTI